MDIDHQITHPLHPSLDALCTRLADGARQLDAWQGEPRWPAEQLRLCAEFGVFRWFLPSHWGGFAWSDEDVIRGYLRLSAACLTTTFILTQRTGACQRIADGQSPTAAARWLPALATGDAFATVGISHLTTSRRHLGQAVLTARNDGDGFVLNGYSPWVTGGIAADVAVLGATLPDGQQILAAVPMHLPGVTASPPPRLVGLSHSCTGEIRLADVRLDADCLLAGPAENVMRRGAGAGTGGLQTSTLAIGLADAAVDFLERQAVDRPELGSAAGELRRDQQSLQTELLAAAAGQAACSNDDLRVRANSLVLRATQAALAAAKGAGYVEGHPAGRWCREALFFLVWSCPQPVLAANLCELAGIE